MPMVKLTGGQRIDLLGVRKEDLPKVWADLDMPSGYAYGKSFRTVKTCVGSDFCRFGSATRPRWASRSRSASRASRRPAKMKLAVTGCPRNCAEACARTSASSRSTAAAGRSTSAARPGAHIRKGDLLATVDTPDEVITLTGRFLQYYRENANWLERTYAFVPRVGIEQIRAVIVDDADGHRRRPRRADGRPPSPPTATRGRSGREPAIAGPVPPVAAAARRCRRCRSDDAPPTWTVDRFASTTSPSGRAAPSPSTAQVAVFRLRDGAPARVSAVCPHAGGPLADGLTDDEVVICPLHQHVFDLATGCSPPASRRFAVYTVRVDESGDVHVALPVPAEV